MATVALRTALMISVQPPGVALFGRLLLKAERIAMRRRAGLVTRRRRQTEDWHSPAELWPDFTEDSTRI